MPRLRTGSILKRKEKRGDKEIIAIYARVTFTDPETGKRFERKKRATSITHANELKKKMLRDIDDHGEKVLLNERMTFGQLADYYEKYYLIPPVYHDGRKIDGMRSWEKAKRLLKIIRPYFEKKPLRSITYNDLRRFKTERLQTKTWRNDERSTATVNRELSMLQRIFHVAVQQGWLIRDPFKQGSKPLISPADEKPRERVLSKDEEERLLAQCTGKREHLRAILICFIDTGMRRGEIFKMTWADVDLENRFIHVQAYNTKTLRERFVPITDRLARELEALWEQSTKQKWMTVFGIRDDVNVAFRSACKDAGLEDLRKHDLRHTFATRLTERGMADSFVEKLLGHTQPKTTRRYINLTPETIIKAGEMLNKLNAQATEQDVTIN